MVVISFEAFLCIMAATDVHRVYEFRSVKILNCNETTDYPCHVDVAYVVNVPIH